MMIGTARVRMKRDPEASEELRMQRDIIVIAAREDARGNIPCYVRHHRDDCARRARYTLIIA